ncbi:MAG: ABZJ_00895 family protein [Alphaproteobacteria bacterium]|nr:ABZJ_00895 family protein [Alphaproteobacteria bacterium]
MNDTPTYTVAANLRWFGLFYVAAVVVLVVIVGVLQTMGVELPTTGLGIGLFAGVVAAAGQRFATRRAWTSRDRNLLALGYMIVAASISCLVAASLIVVDSSTYDEIARSGALAGMAVLVVAVVGAIYFVTARLTLRLIARQLAAKIGGTHDA